MIPAIRYNWRIDSLWPRKSNGMNERGLWSTRIFSQQHGCLRCEAAGFWVAFTNAAIRGMRPMQDRAARIFYRAGISIHADHAVLDLSAMDLPRVKGIKSVADECDEEKCGINDAERGMVRGILGEFLVVA